MGSLIETILYFMLARRIIRGLSVCDWCHRQRHASQEGITTVPVTNSTMKEQYYNTCIAYWVAKWSGPNFKRKLYKNLIKYYNNAVVEKKKHPTKHHSQMDTKNIPHIVSFQLYATSVKYIGDIESFQYWWTMVENFRW